jgi:hypothetical protein
MAQPVDSLGLPADERLRIYRVNRDAAKVELRRVKGVYYQEYVTGASQERLNQISSWASLVRNAAGIRDDDPAYGNSQFVAEDVQNAALGFDASTGNGGTVSGIASNANSVVTVVVGGLVLMVLLGMVSKK